MTRAAAEHAATKHAAKLTTAQSLGGLLKSARDIMRKDKGLNGDLDRLPMLTWIMFLKFLDDLEQTREQEATLAGQRFRPAIESPYRWRDWAANSQGITGDDLIAFVNQDEAVRPDGERGPGLFAYLRKLTSTNGDSRRDVIATVFRGVDNRMRSGYLLRDVINRVHGIHFTATDELHTLGNLYESMLREMRDAAGDSGEFYTPRAVVRLMVKLVDPQIGETVLDPAAGTGGFLVEAFEHLKPQAVTVGKHRLLQDKTLFGFEPKPLPYLLCQMNLLLHGVDSPWIDPSNALRFKLTEIGEQERVDVIMTNPPFGGEEEKGIQGNFPDDRQTAETALLFLQIIMRRLHRAQTPTGRAARAGVVVPHGTLSAPGVAARIRQELLSDFNLTCVIRLPHNVFAPYTDIQTNLLFFERGGPTTSIFFCELSLPDGVTLSKTRPITFEMLSSLLPVINARKQSENSWFVPVTDLDAEYNLDVKNPNRRQRQLPTVRELANDLQNQLDATATRLSLFSALDALAAVIKEAPVRRLADLTKECDERIGSSWSSETRLLGVTNEAGLTLPKVPIGRTPGKYKIVREGYLVYNPMRINIGSIGIARDSGQTGIVSPDYVVFKCHAELIPAYLFYYLRSEAGRHAIRLRTKGSVRFRLYYEKLATLDVPVPVSLGAQEEFAAMCREIEALGSDAQSVRLSSSRLLDSFQRLAFDDSLFASSDVTQESLGSIAPTFASAQ